MLATSLTGLVEEAGLSRSVVLLGLLLAVSGPVWAQKWSVTRSCKYEARGPSSGYSLTVRSDGSGITDYWATGSAVGFKPVQRTAKVSVSKSALARLAAAVKDPDLARQTPEPGLHGQLRVTVDGVTRTFGAQDDSYSGAAGRLAEALKAASAWPPAVSRR